MNDRVGIAILWEPCKQFAFNYLSKIASAQTRSSLKTNFIKENILEHWHPDRASHPKSLEKKWELPQFVKTKEKENCKIAGPHSGTEKTFENES